MKKCVKAGLRYGPGELHAELARHLPGSTLHRADLGRLQCNHSHPRVLHSTILCAVAANMHKQIPGGRSFQLPGAALLPRCCVSSLQGKFSAPGT